MIFGKKQKSLDGRVWQRLRRYVRDRRGNIAAVTALLIIPLVGFMGIATEASSWFLIQRAMQNAADSAVVAAAQNDIAVSGGTTTYGNEAKSVAAGYGFINGGNTTVTPAKNVACPAPLTANGNACYQVTISRNVPIYLSNIVGYSGTGGSGTQTVSTWAIAGVQNTTISDCIWTGSYRVNGSGGASINMNGCDIQSNGDTTCNGTNASGQVGHFFYGGTNSKCAPATAASQTADPYTSLYPRTNIPANSCANPGQATSYWQASGNYGPGGGGKGKGGGPSQPANTQWNGSFSPTSGVYCGDVTVTANTTISGSGPIVIENGSLIVSSGVKLSGTGVTLIFTGPTITGFSPSHIPPTDGTLDISAPTSGTWSGVAIYQDPNLTSGVDWSSSGNALNWDVTGLIYMPKSNISFSGTINKATGGANCFTMVAASVLLSGTVKIQETQSGCNLAGLNTLPTSVLPRVALVQ